MTFGDMTAEMFLRGFDHVPPVRIKRWLNDSYQEINEAADWPFLNKDASGVAPLAVTDLRRLLTVFSSTDSLPLKVVERAFIVATYGSVTAPTTTPMFAFYDPASSPSVRIFPAAAAKTISIRYISIPADLSAITDTPTFPARYHDLIVEGASARAYSDMDRYDLASGTSDRFRQGLEYMKAALLPPTVPNLDPTEAYDEGSAQ